MEDDKNEQTQIKDSGEVVTRSGKKGGKKRTIFRLFILIVVIALLAGGAWYVLSSPEQNGESLIPGSGLNRPQNEVENTIPTPTATPAPVDVDRSEIRIELLNGTGIPGEAGLVQSELEELGYENIDVGNADDQDNEGTIVTFSSELPQSFMEEFIEDLEDIYTEVESNTTSTLEDYDIRIVAGLRRGYTPAPTRAPEPTSTPSDESAESTPTETPTASPTPTP